MKPHPTVETAPPEPSFTTCVCGVLVLARVWGHRDGWRTLSVPVSAGLGEPHKCAPDDPHATSTQGGRDA